ncbi:hypothetical protein GCK72_011773 [Caenorhabditis remanei]|uniref:AF4/FMR2 C-terminal homology domain-containing protein n=1 Tax=Caenorhabditis remanei TaxID=31234 RepID=A0A6A5H8H4_CAERE|nr:hypothetical protein GCK72_011773 [Caenorhabditis remanei]KAF1763507.1 hypothetical protein GCK72_011773 [Caenorhabditis remanei]
MDADSREDLNREIRRSLSEWFGPFEEFHERVAKNQGTSRHGLIRAKMRPRPPPIVTIQAPTQDSPSHVPVHVALQSMKNLVEEPLSALPNKFDDLNKFKNNAVVKGNVTSSLGSSSVAPPPVAPENNPKKRKIVETEQETSAVVIEAKRKKETNLRNSIPASTPDSGVHSTESDLLEEPNSDDVVAMLNIMKTLDMPKLSPLPEEIVREFNREKSAEREKEKPLNLKSKELFLYKLDKETKFLSDSSVSSASTSREPTPEPPLKGTLKLKHLKPERLQKLMDLAKTRGKLIDIPVVVEKAAVVVEKMREKSIEKPVCKERSRDRSVEKMRPEKPVARPGRSDRRDERPERSERSERPEKSDRPEKSEKSGRSDKYERPERSERPEKSSRSDKPDRSERPEKTDRSERPEKSDRYGRPERTERVEKVVEKVERTERIEKSDKMEKFERSEKSEKNERIERNERLEKPREKKIPTEEPKPSTSTSTATFSVLPPPPRPPSITPYVRDVTTPISNTRTPTPSMTSLPPPPGHSPFTTSQKPPNKTVQSLQNQSHQSQFPPRNFSPSGPSPRSIRSTTPSIQSSRPSSSLSTHDNHVASTSEVVTVITPSKQQRWACQWDHTKMKTMQRLPIHDPTTTTKSKGDFYHMLAKEWKSQADRSKDKVLRPLNYMLSSIYFVLEAIWKADKERSHQARIQCASIYRDTYELLGVAVFQSIRETDDTIAAHLLPRVKVIGQIMLSVMQYQMYLFRADQAIKNYARLEMREIVETIDIRSVSRASDNSSVHSQNHLSVPPGNNRMASAAHGNTPKAIPSAGSTPSGPTGVPISPWIVTVQTCPNAVTMPQVVFDAYKSQLKTSNCLILASRYWEDMKILVRQVDSTFIKDIETICGKSMGMDMQFDQLAQFVLTAVASLKAEYEEELRQPLKPALEKVKKGLEIAIRIGNFHSDRPPIMHRPSQSTPQPGHPPPQRPRV